MFPLLASDDGVYIQKASNYEIDDIVVFKKKGRLIAHRLVYVKRKGKSFITKGDNNPKADPKISADKILGKIDKIRRGKELVLIDHLYLAQSSLYLTQIKKLNRAMVNEKIRYILLKGLPLHLFYAKTPPKRLYLDADILIRTADFEKVKKVLIKLGFKTASPVLFGKKIKEFSQISFVNNTRPFPVVIDVHLEPAVGFTKVLSLNRLIPNLTSYHLHLFRNTKMAKVEKTDFPILNPENLLLYLLLHLFHHNFQGTHRMELIDAVIRKKDINWRLFTNTANNFAYGNFIYPGISLLQKYYATPLPSKLNPKLRVLASTKLLTLFLTYLHSPFNEGAANQQRAKRFLFLMFLSGVGWPTKTNVLLSKDSLDYFSKVIKFSFFKS
jgi:hypothetical protein